MDPHQPTSPTSAPVSSKGTLPCRHDVRCHFLDFVTPTGLLPDAIRGTSCHAHLATVGIDPYTSSLPHLSQCAALAGVRLDGMKKPGGDADAGVTAEGEGEVGGMEKLADKLGAG